MPGGDADLLDAQQSEKRAIQRPRRKQRRDDGRRLAVGVRQPRVQRREAHFRAVADKEQEARRLQPRRLQIVRAARESRQSRRDNLPPDAPRPRRGKNWPADAKAMPTEQIRRYFHVASSDGGAGENKLAARWPAWFLRSPTQIRPKCWLTVTRVIAARNKSRQPMKTASGALSNNKPSSGSVFAGCLLGRDNRPRRLTRRKTARW